ncbi:hypothetical protein Tsubulata_016636 [Turnera subulata]|uniref:Uncharacterized protein n=1 Tax=Turnera subulata TaxID=218843 RepID=A0A9Q0FNU1_9ROSI|nr:hypothetical protein Tsubulata_016636 [Turnera subulata]
MAQTMGALILLSPPPQISYCLSSSTLPIRFGTTQKQTLITTSRRRRRGAKSLSVSAATTASLEALIFDCDGVILESEHLHRQAYNDAFAHFNVICPPSPSSSSSATEEALNWSPEFYDVLQNRIGGGKPKMRWYFKEHGWPSSTILETPPEDDEDRAKLIDTLQARFLSFPDWQSALFPCLIGRLKGTKRLSNLELPGVLRLMDEAKAAERFQGLDCFLAGDDVKEKKPDPSIYVKASERLGVSEKDCLVVEDSVIGLQDFKDAIAIYPDLGNVRLKDLELLLQNFVAAN